MIKKNLKELKNLVHDKMTNFKKLKKLKKDMQLVFDKKIMNQFTYLEANKRNALASDIKKSICTDMKEIQAKIGQFKYYIA